MKFKALYSAALLSVPASLPAAAVSAMQATGAPAPDAARTDLYGDPVPPGAGYRTITITPDTRYVNITGGEVINFIVGGKTFSWSFFVAPQIQSFPLNQIAPSGILDHPVIAYIAPDPKYWGRG